MVNQMKIYMYVIQIWKIVTQSKYVCFILSFLITSCKYICIICNDYKYISSSSKLGWKFITTEPVHEISNNVVCATSKASDQPAHMRSLIRAFASCLSIL